MRPERLAPHPDDGARRRDLVQHLRPVVRHPRRKHLRLQDRGRDGGPLQAVQRKPERLRTLQNRFPRHPLPGEDQPPVGVRSDRLHLTPQSGEGSLPQDAQVLGVAEFPTDPTRAKLALQDAADPRQDPERGLDRGRSDSETPGDVVRPERSVGPGVPSDEIAQRVRHAIQKGLWEPRGGGHTQGVAIAPGVLRRDEPGLFRNGDRGDPPVPVQRANPTVCLLGGIAALPDLSPRQVPQPEEEVVDGIRMPGPPAGVQTLQSRLERRDRVRIEQLAQVRLPEQLAQARRIHGERLRPQLCQRGVPLVDEIPHIAEEERRGKGRGGTGVGGDDPDGARADIPQDLDECRQIEDVLQALTVGFQQDRERGVRRGGGEQLGRPLPLLPEGRSPPRGAPRQEQRPGGGLAEARREERVLT